MNKTDDKFGLRHSLSKPTIRRHVSPTHDSSFQEISTLLICQNDLERTKDKIYHVKKAINKKCNEINKIKGDISRYDEALRKNIKTIEDITSTTDKLTSMAICKLLFNPNESDLPTELVLSRNYIYKFKELLAVNLLKTKNKELSEQVSTRKSQIDVIKSDSTSNTITKLEKTFLINTSELNELRNNYDSLQAKYGDMFVQAEKVIEERDQLKSEMNKYKSEYFYSKIRMTQLKTNKLTKTKINDSLSNFGHIRKREIITLRKEMSSSFSQYNSNLLNQSMNNKFSDNSKSMISTYLSEKAKLEKKIEELTNYNSDAMQRNNSKESVLKKKSTEYTALVEKSRSLQNEFGIKKKDSERDVLLKKQIEKLKKEMSAFNDKISSFKEKDLSYKLVQLSERKEEIENKIEKEKDKNIDLKEEIETDKINAEILTANVENNKSTIEKLRKEINELLKSQESPKQQEKLPPLTNEQDNFFSTGINVKSKSIYDQDIDINKEKEKEKESIQQQVKDNQISEENI